MSQTDVSLSVVAKTISKPDKDFYEVDITKELEKLMSKEPEGDIADPADLLRRVLKDHGEDYEVLAVDMFKTKIQIVPEFPVLSINIKIEFVISLNFSAGLSAKVTYLAAKQVGFTGDLHSGRRKVRTYQHDFSTAGDELHDIDFSAAGYICLRAGIRGSLSVSLFGWDDLFDAGLSIEVGAFAKAWGLFHLEKAKQPIRYNAVTTRDTMSLYGGLYMEFGVYLKIEAFAKSKVFGVSLKADIYSEDFVLCSWGDRYVLSKYPDGDLHKLIREGKVSTLKINGCMNELFETEFIDLTTGETVKGGDREQGYQSNVLLFEIKYSSPYFTTEGGAASWSPQEVSYYTYMFLLYGIPFPETREIAFHKDLLGDPLVKPFYPANTQRVDATAYIYYKGSSLSFNNRPIEPRKLKLTWVSRDFDLKSVPDLDEPVTVQYILDVEGVETLLDEREVLPGQVPGAPNVAEGYSGHWKT